MDDYLYEELSYKLRGALFEVYNILGPGFKESAYHNALAKEFRLRGIPFEEKKRLSITYKDEQVGIYEPDFVVDDKIIVEIKATPETAPVYETQLYYYLKGTDYKLGFLVNFGGKELEIRRRIYDKPRTQTQNSRR